MNFNCPCCGAPGVSFLQKLYLSSKKPAECRACGEKASVQVSLAMVSLIPFLLALIVSASYRGTLSWAIVLSGFGMYLMVYLFAVPLQRATRTS